MQANGYPDACLTPPGADGGIDVVSRDAVAQVKFHQKAVGLSEVQRLFGISQSVRKQPLFFSLAGYSPKAFEWGCRHEIEMYSLTPIRRL
jgi:hypothetical protein